MQLFTLGSVDLRSNVRDTSALLAQPKRLGLLIYLAAARPHGFHRRDTLLELFWPKLGALQARRALRQALHFLRQSVGEDAIVTRGEAVSVSDTFWCDARAFDSALGQGELFDALAMYRGEFLAGFHVSDASSRFDHWVDAERTYVRERAVASAWELAEREDQRGDAERAAFWARRAADVHATNEYSIRKLIGLLGKQGDRRGAMRAYEAFARRLDRDYQLQPAPETVALAESMRERAG